MKELLNSRDLAFRVKREADRMMRDALDSLPDPSRMTPAQRSRLIYSAEGYAATTRRRLARGQQIEMDRPATAQQRTWGGSLLDGMRCQLNEMVLTEVKAYVADIFETLAMTDMAFSPQGDRLLSESEEQHVR